jgi:hypothetical protein
MLYPVELWVQAAATAAFSAKSGCAATGVLGVRGCIGLANSENNAAASGGGFGLSKYPWELVYSALLNVGFNPISNCRRISMPND